MYRRFFKAENNQNVKDKERTEQNKKTEKTKQ